MKTEILIEQIEKYWHTFDEDQKQEVREKVAKLIGVPYKAPDPPRSEDELIGRKVIGFKFRDYQFGRLVFADAMDECIGKTGEILSYSPRHDSYRIYFPDNDMDWSYPAELVRKNLVKTL